MIEIKSKIIQYMIFIGIIVLLNGCMNNREPEIPQFNSGMKKTQEWVNYNQYAKEKNQPILDFAATTIMYKFGEGSVPNYDTFISSDPRVTIQTKWHNCKSTDLYEFEFYLPDGRLAHYEYFEPTEIYSKWTLGRHIYLKDMPTANIKGKWSVNVKANKKQVITKNFNILNSNETISKINPSIKIGFAPYWNSKNSTWDHSIASSTYLSLASLRDDSNIEIMPPNLYLKEIGNPQFDYKVFKKQLIEDLKDEQGIVLPIIKKYNLDYLIVGRVKSNWNSNTQVTNFETYIVDANKKSIIETISTNVYLNSSSYNISTTQKVKGMHPLRIKVYKVLYEDLDSHIRNLD